MASETACECAACTRSMGDMGVGPADPGDEAAPESGVKMPCWPAMTTGTLPADESGDVWPPMGSICGVPDAAEPEPDAGAPMDDDVVVVVVVVVVVGSPAAATSAAFVGAAESLDEPCSSPTMVERRGTAGATLPTGRRAPVTLPAVSAVVMSWMLVLRFCLAVPSACLNWRMKNFCACDATCDGEREMT